MPNTGTESVSPTRKRSFDAGKRGTLGPLLRSKSGVESRPLAFARTEADDYMDNLLFQDESRADGFLKGLISSEGLHGAWSEVLRRVAAVEDKCDPKEGAVTGEQYEDAFISRRTCRELLVEVYSGQLTEHAERIEALEAATGTTRAGLAEHTQDLEKLWARVNNIGCTVDSALLDITRAEEERRREHEVVNGLFKQMEGDFVERVAVVNDKILSLSDEQNGLQSKHESLVNEMQGFHEFLFSEGLQKELARNCEALLAHYIQWDDMVEERTAIHERCLCEIAGPVKEELLCLSSRISQVGTLLETKETALLESTAEVDAKVMATDMRLDEKIADVMVAVGLCSPMETVSHLEGQFNRRIEGCENNAADFRTQSMQKISDAFDRLTVLQTIVGDHEHILQHHAEELMNRATNYDVIVCTQRLDKCAYKERVDKEIAELQKNVHWQGVKVENLTFKSSFLKSEDLEGLQASAEGPIALSEVHGQASPRAASERGPMLPNEAVSPGSPSMASEQRPCDTELQALAQRQLESLAQGVFSLAHGAFRATSLGASKAQRVERENELLHHLKCVLHWITHRSAPSDWDPMKLTSVAIKCAQHVPDDDTWTQSSSPSRARSRRQTMTAGPGGEGGIEIGKVSYSPFGSPSNTPHASHAFSPHEALNSALRSSTCSTQPAYNPQDRSSVDSLPCGSSSAATVHGGQLLWLPSSPPGKRGGSTSVPVEGESMLIPEHGLPNLQIDCCRFGGLMKQQRLANKTPSSSRATIPRGGLKGGKYTPRQTGNKPDGFDKLKKIVGSLASGAETGAIPSIGQRSLPVSPCPEPHARQFNTPTGNRSTQSLTSAQDDAHGGDAPATLCLDYGADPTQLAWDSAAAAAAVSKGGTMAHRGNTPAPGPRQW